MSNNFLPLRIYRNLELFLNYRKYILVNHPQVDSSSWLSDEKFIEIIYNDEYVLVECAGEIPNFIYIFNSETKYSADSDSLKKLIANTPFYNEKQINIMLVNRYPYDTHRTKALTTTINELTTIEPILYKDLISNPFDHHMVPIHETVGVEDLDEIKEWLCRDLSELPKIKRSEKPMIWLGPKIGDVIRITANGDSGDVIAYRLVE